MLPKILFRPVLIVILMDSNKNPKRKKERKPKGYWVELIRRENEMRKEEVFEEIRKKLSGWDKIIIKPKDAIERYLTARLSSDVIQRVNSISKLSDISISIGAAGDMLSKWKAKSLLTETFIKFVPPSIFSMAIILFGGLISSVLNLKTFGMTFIPLFLIMIWVFFLAYQYHIRIAKGVLDFESYLRLLDERRKELLNRGKEVETVTGK